MARAGTKSPKNDAGIIEITLTTLIECGYTHSHSKATLAKINPVRKAGRVNYYDLSTAIRALNSGELDAKSRKELASAELAEEKVRRLKLESVDSKEARNIWTDKLVRLRDAIKRTSLSRKDQRELSLALKTELDRVDDELRSAAFVEDVGDE